MDLGYGVAFYKVDWLRRTKQGDRVERNSEIAVELSNDLLSHN